ncbi:hypothetical protein KC640_03520 [Candidatus Dojkabacteria bacterium]|uniref:UMP kinase n=1 Tax=Candidatus Dojkabacteria bacterium TaxID=2099670 RepID=A0A955KZ34_9BACT|nr:hypothetical protein [Candidatus Dojkabacteria bacterium]
MQDIVLKIGGSLLSPSAEKMFDFSYALQLRDLLAQFSTDYRFWIAVGGGYLNRYYQKLASEHGEDGTIDLHKIGVSATNLNAEIFHGLLDDLCQLEVLRYQQYEEFMQKGAPALPPELGRVVVTGGSRPGQSNDWNALQLALRLGSSQVIDVKNVDGVYSADPRSNPNAEFIPSLSWDEYLDIIGNPTEHAPGAHYPVDPVAAREAKAEQIKYIIVGSDLANLREVVWGGEFHGTTIAG